MARANGGYISLVSETPQVTLSLSNATNSSKIVIVMRYVNGSWRRSGSGLANLPYRRYFFLNADLLRLSRSTSHWTGAAIIVKWSRTKTYIVTRWKTSSRRMLSSLAG